MGLDIKYINGQTPLDEDENDGLLIPTIITRGDLDEFEQYNIEKAIEWTLKNSFSLKRILTVKFIKELHKKMFGEVWSWAGKFRTSNKNIGVDKFQIIMELQNLLDDCIYWIEKDLFEFDEIAIRFSHRLVKIHLFPNGNGRHSRLIADIIVSQAFDKEVFTWGSKNIQHKSDVRTQYIDALRKADKNNYTDLIKFARQ